MVETFATLVERSARRAPGRPALVWDGGRLSYGDLAERVERLASALIHCASSVVSPSNRKRPSPPGLTPDHRIALQAPNGWRYVVALLACWRAGACVAPLDPLLSADERAAILADLDPDPIDPLAVLDAPPTRWDAPPSLPVPVPTIPGALPSGPTPAEPALTHAHASPTTVAPSGDALILYTSGSTGAPKGAVHTHANVRTASEAWAGSMMGLTPDDVVLAAVPLTHAYGIMGALLAPLMVGATVAIVERFEADSTLAAIARHRATVLPGVATMFRRLLEATSFSPSAVATLRIALSGTAPCPWELAREWRERTGVRILRGYGSTELFRPISYCWHDAEDDPEAIGRPAPGVEVRTGDDGELWIRSPCAMRGYWNAPEATREVSRDGWFATGDVARITPAGLVAIVGRTRERILRGGYSVFPQEVEAVLAAHAAVAEAAVLGVPHAELGEEVAAFVALRPGAATSADELIAFCKRRLAPYKYPRTVTFVEGLPKAPTGKVLRSKIKERGV
jgi:long-chain acyl-CoA synthetase